MTEFASVQCPAWYQGVMQAIAGEHPCGESLEYDPDFILLQGRLQPKLSAEYGSFVEAAEPVNWAEIERDCQQLMARSKDIRLIITLMRCRFRQTGVHALSEGLEALLFALDNWPDDLHPQLLDEGEYDPIIRANAFAELEAIDGFITDFRQLTLPKAAGMQISIRDYEKANASPREEGALPAATLNAIQEEWHQRQETALFSLKHALTLLEILRERLVDSLGDDAPEFSLLFSILRHFSTSLRVDEAVLEEHAVHESEETISAITVENSEDAPSLPSVSVPCTTTAHIQKSKGITNRTEALQQLRQVRLWFTDKEPSNPIIPVLALSEQIIGKSFVELLALLPQELISKITAETETTS